MPSQDGTTARGRIPGVRRRREAPDPLAAFIALGYALVPAAGPRGPGCSCTRVGCPRPAAHPLTPGWRNEASADPARLEYWRLKHPDANFVTPTGRTHDVLDVPSAAGKAALATLDAAAEPVGPVAATPDGDRYLFFTAPRPGAADEGDPDEWWPSVIDAAPETDVATPSLLWHTRGSYVLVPPAQGVSGNRARWIRPPETALPDPLRLLTALADACDSVAATSAHR